MDSITHLTQKILAERARQPVAQPTQIPDTAPPPYTASDGNDSESDSDDDSDDDEDDEQPIKLTINAANSIQGNNNLVPTSPSALSDATKFSALLLHAVNRMNASASSSKRKGRVNVDLTINCGTTIIGDRNVVGSVGVRAKSGEAAVVVGGEAAAVAGAKRKAGGDEATKDEEHSRAKRRATSPPPGQKSSQE